MTEIQRKAINELIDYFDTIGEGSIRIVWKDDEIVVYPTSKITLSTDLSEDLLDKQNRKAYNVARVQIIG